jgi:hypothetical protein
MERYDLHSRGFLPLTLTFPCYTNFKVQKLDPRGMFEALKLFTNWSDQKTRHRAFQLPEDLDDFLNGLKGRFNIAVLDFNDGEFSITTEQFFNCIRHQILNG